MSFSGIGGICSRKLLWFPPGLFLQACISSGMKCPSTRSTLFTRVIFNEQDYYQRLGLRVYFLVTNRRACVITYVGVHRVEFTEKYSTALTGSRVAVFFG